MNNYVTLRGFVGSSPERITRKDSKDPIGCKFRLGVSDSYRDREGNWVERESQWVTVKCWGRLGMNVYHSIKKGDPVLSVGRIGQEEWADTLTGQNRASLFLVASAVGADLNHCMTFRAQSFETQEKAAITGENEEKEKKIALLESGEYEIVTGEELLIGEEAPF
ncbi:single-stranded DNA-binding protein [Actinomycetaceae bacterium TAE3-ERU4]|nr:single-stranded DNA-binding protein [Actinomycetaceae bacterium TAE3-ERU4]